MAGGKEWEFSDLGVLDAEFWWFDTGVDLIHSKHLKPRELQACSEYSFADSQNTSI